MEKFKTLLFKTFGNVYIPKEIINSNDKYILHISDTPENFYPALKRIITKLKPYCIIHTGDLVDNIKLERKPFYKNAYKTKLKILIGILENSAAKKIYICMGNHDREELVKPFCSRSILLNTATKIKIFDFNFTLSHFSSEILKDSSDYNLFGHDLSIKNKIENNKFFLNGILSINIINLKSSEIYTLPYPILTNDARLLKHKIGL